MAKRIVLLGAALLVFAGCGAERRFVTALYWSTSKRVYIAYTEAKGGMMGQTSKAKILKCDVNDDNSMACAEQADADRALNP